MSKTAHTPTPWRLVVEGDEDTIITRTLLGPDEKVARGLNETCFFTTGSFSDEVEQANAEFAVMAVNSHQELVTRLYNLVNACEVMQVDKEFTTIELAVAEARETLSKIIK